MAENNENEDQDIEDIADDSTDSQELYEDEEIEDEDLEDSEADDDDDDDEDEEDDDEEGEAKLEKKAEEKVLKNKVKRIKRRVARSIFPILKIDERRTISQARKKYPKDVADIEQLIKAKRQNILRNGLAGGSALVGLLFFLGIILIIVLAIAAVFDLMFGWLNQGDGEGMSTQFGVNGEDFYGCRVVYTDDEQSKLDIVRDYVGVVQASVTLLEENNSNLDITIELPSEEYDYNNFDENTFASEYADLYGILTLMVDDVYSYDQTEEIAETTFDEKLEAIKYFGFDNTLSTTIAETISGYINDNDMYASTDEDNPVDSTIEQVIVDTIGSLLADEEYNIRTEKIYLKDYIFADSESMMENIAEENYIAMIFMPKTDVHFNYFSFILSNIDFDNFNMYVSRSGGQVILTGTQWSSESEEGVDSYLFESSQNLIVPAPTFTNIDTTNLNLLSQGVSTYELLQMEEADYSIYLESITDEQGNNVLTWKDGDVTVRFESEQPFYFAEFETDWS